ncbi:MAG: PEGA domain-containing protein [Porticoccus sp.]
MTDKSIPTKGESLIAPVEFTPLEGEIQRSTFTLQPIAILTGLALLICLLVLWFLLTAKSVIISIDPATAELRLEGGITFELADHYLIRPGEYQLIATSEGYQDLTQSFIVSEDDNQLLPLALEKKPGHLQITTNPADAEIWVDGQQVGISPMTVTPLSPGGHQLEIRAPRYYIHQSNVDIEGLDHNQTLNVDLDPAWGQIQLNSIPPNAVVTINNKPRGHTPLTTELLTTGGIVSIVLKGYKPWNKALQVPPGETLSVPEIILEPADGVIEATSIPSGATITVDGQYRGTTPITLEVAANEKHQISLFLNGYATKKQSLLLAPGETEQLTISMKANVGGIRVLASPSDASVWIDGVRRGTAGKTFRLPARSHRIDIKRPGYASQTRTVTPQPKLDQVVRVTLLTEQEARWASIPKVITSPGDQTLKLFKPKNKFVMGASRREPGRRANEVLRDVQLTRPFYLATKEVTNSEFKRFQRQHSSRHINGNTLDLPMQPVVNVSWQKAALYCNWLSKKEKLTLFYKEEQGKIVGEDVKANGYRLPTEAEWAWAARVTDSGVKKHIWGNQFPPTTGNFADISAGKAIGQVVINYNDNYPGSAPVGSFPSNHKGIFDLGGNVAEWVNDYYGIEFSLSMTADKDPSGPAKGDIRVIRGASWRHSSITELRLSFRDYGIDPRDDVGFRIARYVE